MAGMNQTPVNTKLNQNELEIFKSFFIFEEPNVSLPFILLDFVNNAGLLIF